MVKKLIRVKKEDLILILEKWGLLWRRLMGGIGHDDNRRELLKANAWRKTTGNQLLQSEEDTAVRGALLPF